MATKQVTLDNGDIIEWDAEPVIVEIPIVSILESTEPELSGLQRIKSFFNRRLDRSKS